MERAQRGLAQAPGQHYSGRVETVDGSVFEVDLDLSRAGVATGTITAGELSIPYYGVRGMVFIRAPKSYWVAKGWVDIHAERLAEQWSKVPPDHFGVDFTSELAPERFAAGLYDGGLVLVGATVEIDGRGSVPIKSGAYTVYLSPRSDLPVITRIVVAQQHSMNQRLKTLTLDISALTTDHVRAMFDRMTGVGRSELVSARSGEVRVEWSGETEMDPCGQYSCVVTTKLSSTPTDPAIHIESVQVTVDFTFDVDGISAGVCHQQIQLPGSGSGTATCTGHYVIPADGLEHSWNVLIKLDWRALGDPEVEHIVQVIADQNVALR
ncbi:hypothetical protein [Nocardia sp. NPDC051832]|uniref:hypothetical protein n=1 Tax=Nocardia sp. NPDC051832 TaxID=3155673 RepID=UPI003446AA65